MFERAEQNDDKKLAREIVFRCFFTITRFLSNFFLLFPTVKFLGSSLYTKTKSKNIYFNTVKTTVKCLLIKVFALVIHTAPTVQNVYTSNVSRDRELKKKKTSKDN